MTKVAYFRFKDNGDIIAVFDTNKESTEVLDSYMFVGQHSPVMLDVLIEDCDLVLGKPVDDHGDMETHLIELVGYNDLHRDNLWIIKRITYEDIIN